MKYSVKIECENQKSVLNFRSTLDSSILTKLFKGIVKPNYSITVSKVSSRNKRARRSLDTAILWAKDVKFYKNVLKTTYKHEYERKHLFSMTFPACVHLKKYWHSEWGCDYTFFELSLYDSSETCCVSLDFEKCRKLFEAHHLDLNKSVTCGLWYTRDDIRLEERGNELFIGKDIVTSIPETKRVRVEL